MEKIEILKAFDDVAHLADVFGCSRQYVYQWPDTLPTPLADRAVGAAVRAGKLSVAEKYAEIHSGEKAA